MPISQLIGQVRKERSKEQSTETFGEQKKEQKAWVIQTDPEWSRAKYKLQYQKNFYKVRKIKKFVLRSGAVNIQMP